MSTKNFPAVITAQIGNVATQAVDARRLHEFLGVGRDFSNWIRGRIEKYSFQQGVDYEKINMLCSPNLANTTYGFQKAVDYALSLNMAKELAMIENNEKGRAYRRYLIECERRYQQGNSAQNPDKILLTKDEYIDLLKARITSLEGARRQRFSSQEIAEIERLRRLGVSTADIARNLDRKAESVRSVISRLEGR